jgi:DNA modification methylase
MNINTRTDPSRVIVADVIDGLRTLDAGSVHCCVTSPPYWGLRDYGVDGQIGLEKTPEEFVARMVEVFAEVRRVLREDGTLWLNLGDSYAATSKNRTHEQAVAACTLAGSPNGNASLLRQQNKIVAGMKPKDLCMIPWRVALALQADGWWLRSVICWAKKSPMPESVTDRPTSSWEPIFLLAKSERYFYDAEAVKEAAVQTGTQVRKAANGSTLGGGAYGRSHLGDAIPEHERRATVDGPDSVVETSGTRNQRNVWHLGPEPYREAHFATFPTEIPRRAIKAGTSEKGCCAACGAPWVRVVSVEYVKSPVHGEGSTTGKPDCPHGMTGMPRLNKKTGTTGWEPGCTCGAGVVPCVVLDPFLGSGTTVAVARELGRHGVGCELNPEYAALARERIGKAERPATFRSERAGDAPLFVAT